MEVFIVIIGLLILFGMLMANGKGTPGESDKYEL